jgi:hypothetical protein
MKIQARKKDRRSWFKDLLWLTITIVSSIHCYHAGYGNAESTCATQVILSPSKVTTKETSPVVQQVRAKPTETAVEETAVKVVPPAAVVDNKIGAGCTAYSTKGKEIFYETAKSFTPTTDKVTDHEYHTMYGRFLLPYYDLNPTMRMLEIGLGCDMGYGPGASVAIWKKLFPKAVLWEAEFDAECVEKHRDGMLKDINVLTGDQMNNTVLDSWIETSGGNFDVVIDDGGHQNCQIWHSFQKLWPTVKPGGLYFIEDMQVGKNRFYNSKTTDTCDGNFRMFEKLKEFGDMMIYGPNRKKYHNQDIEYIFCQHEACVLGKKKK